MMGAGKHKTLQKQIQFAVSIFIRVYKYILTVACALVRRKKIWGGSTLKEPKYSFPKKLI